MAIILVFILCGISSKLTIIIAPASTRTYTSRSVYDDCNGDGCGLVGIFQVDVFLSNYSSSSGIANDGKSAQQDDIFNATKSGAQLDTINWNSNNIQ